MQLKKEGRYKAQEERQEIQEKIPQRLTEGKIKIIRSEKAHGLVFIEAIHESESKVLQPLSYQPRPRYLITTCVSLTFSGLLVKAEKHSTIKSESIRHHTSSPCIPKPHFKAAT